MQQYQLKQSSTLNLLTLALYCLGLVAIALFLHEMIFLALSLTGLTALLLIQDQSRYRRLKAKDPTVLTLAHSTASIGLNHQGEHLKFEQFRLFSNRWFLILQMSNERVSRNVMLVPDRFDSIDEYLRFRYQIGNMSRLQYAT